MKHSIRILTTTALLTAGLASFGIAQMMGGESDSTSRSGMMNKMGDMSQECKAMSNDLGKLQKRFDAMMQMDDMKTLKTEMKKYQKMLQAMRDKMSQHQTMCMNMMSKMNSGGKMDKGMMMGKDKNDSVDSKEHPHNH